MMKGSMVIRSGVINTAEQEMLIADNEDGSPDGAVH